jgi:hypothetical protein
LLDWKDLSDEERRRVAELVGEGRIADDGGLLIKLAAGCSPRRKADAPQSPAG